MVKLVHRRRVYELAGMKARWVLVDHILLPPGNLAGIYMLRCSGSLSNCPAHDEPPESEMRRRTGEIAAGRRSRAGAGPTHLFDTMRCSQWRPLLAVAEN